MKKFLLLLSLLAAWSMPLTAQVQDNNVSRGLQSLSVGAPQGTNMMSGFNYYSTGLNSVLQPDQRPLAMPQAVPTIAPIPYNPNRIDERYNNRLDVRPIQNRLVADQTGFLRQGPRELAQLAAPPTLSQARPAGTGFMVPMGVPMHAQAREIPNLPAMGNAELLSPYLSGTQQQQDRANPFAFRDRLNYFTAGRVEADLDHMRGGLSHVIDLREQKILETIKPSSEIFQPMSGQGAPRNTSIYMQPAVKPPLFR